MTDKNNLNLILHEIRVKLYPNYLPQAEGTFVAKTDSEKTISAVDVCKSMNNRGGYTGNYDDLLRIVHQYNDEVIYQLCDGFAVTNGYYTIYPGIGGTFNSLNESHDHKKHPVGIRLVIRAKLQNLLNQIVVNVEGLAVNPGYIDMFTDNELEESSMNSIFFPGNMFSIHGSKIKLAGEDPDVGVYFVPVDDPARAVKVTRIAENNASKITGIAPETAYLRHRIEIRTQYTSVSGKFLKAPRVIISPFIIEAA